ncbi:MAG: hypothetical protein ACTSWA_06570 [Candidatus Thorarchaeota archaeon]
MTERDYDYFKKTIEELDPLYSHFNVVVLAAKKDDKWVLLHSSVVLTPGIKWKLPDVPYPKKFFLVKQEMKPIKEFDSFIEDIRDSKIQIGDDEITILDIEKDELHWYQLTPSPESWQMSGYSGLAIRLRSKQIETILNELDFEWDLELRTFFERSYGDFSEFSKAVIDTQLDSYSRSATIDFYAPSWCTIENATLGNGVQTIVYTCPTIFFEHLHLKYSYKTLNSDIKIDIAGNGFAKTPGIEPEPIEPDGKLLRVIDATISQNPNAPLYRLDKSFEGVLESNVVLHKKEVALARGKFEIEGADENPNKVSRFHFERAVELAEMSVPEDDRPHPKVGCVVVKKGEIVVQASRGEIGRGDHAEFIALERKGRGNPDIEGADLITTLEPCTTRSHDKRPCMKWIRSRKIRKVWIGTLDINPVIAGVGELFLQDAGILIGRFPDNLSQAVIKQNEEFFEHIKSKQPQLSADEQREERDLILSTIREQLGQAYNTYTSMMAIVTQYTLEDPSSKKSYPSPSEGAEAESIVVQSRGKIKVLEEALKFALLVETDDILTWIRLADVLFEGHQYGLAGRTYSVATKIDATIPAGWIGIAKVEIAVFENIKYWPAISRVYHTDTSPKSLRSQAWMDIVKETESEKLKIKVLTRAIQLGNRSRTAEELTHQLFESIQGKLDKLDISDDERQELGFVWDALGSAWDHAKEKEISAMCRGMANLVWYEAPIPALEYAIVPFNVAWTLHNHLKHLVDDDVSKAIEESVDRIIEILDLWSNTTELAKLLKDVPEYRNSEKLVKALRDMGIEFDELD